MTHITEANVEITRRFKGTQVIVLVWYDLHGRENGLHLTRHIKDGFIRLYEETREDQVKARDDDGEWVHKVDAQGRPVYETVLHQYKWKVPQ